jgi:WXG100 family type VII secretion target
MAETNISVKFDPVKILEAAAILDQKRAQFERCVQSIRTKVDSTVGYWQGDCSDLYKKKMDELDAKSSELALMFKVLHKDLTDASGIYEAGEAGAVAATQSLPTEGVVRI